MRKEEFDILRFYGDMKPHAMKEQFFWIKTLNKKLKDKQFMEIVKKFCHGGILKCYGNYYFKVKMQDRQHILTDKGDDLLRRAMIGLGGNEEYYRTHKRL